MKKYLKKIYIGIKSSNLWEENRFFIFLYPHARKVSGFLFYGLHLSGHIKRKIIHEIFRLNIIKRIRIKFNKKNFYLHKAKNAVLKENWAEARKFYQQIIDTKSKHPQDSEIKNDAKFNISNLERLINPEKFIEEVSSYKNITKKKKIAVFTAIANNYDTLKLPYHLDSDFDYILFTDSPVQDTGIFQIRPMPFFHENPTRRARFIKTHPHQLLKDYDIAIWVDANIMIHGDIKPIISSFLHSQKAVGAIPHPIRTNLASEAKACIYYEKGDKGQIEEQVQRYKAAGYETDELIESNIMIFNLRAKKIQGFLSDWWAEIDRYSIRDQLSINYSLDKNRIEWHKIMPKPKNARDHELFSLVPHKSMQPTAVALEKKIKVSSDKINPYKSQSFSSIKHKVLSSYQDRTINIIYCVHNALADVKICLASVVKNRKNNNVSLTIIDDGSDKPTEQYLKTFKTKNKEWVNLIRNLKGSGYTKAANQGLRSSKADLSILLNSDTVVTNAWTEKMAHAVFSTPGAGIVGPLSSAASAQSIPNFTSTKNQTATNNLPEGMTVDDMNEYCENWSAAEYYPVVPLVHGFCFGVTKEAIDKVGYFDEKNFPNGYGEENDYCFRAVNAGFNLVLATNTYIYHAKSKSYKSDKRIELMQQGNQKVKDMHGKDRVWRAIVSMQQNPILEKIRLKTQDLYK